MIHTEEVKSGPIVRDIDGQKTYGYHFSFYEKWEEVDYKIGERQLYKTIKSDYEGWEIYSNGKFHYAVCQDSARWCGECDGTFDSSLYEDYVSQMKEYKTDWMNGLSYNKEDGVFSWG